MEKRKRGKTRTARNSAPAAEEVLLQLAGLGVFIAKRGFGIIEGLAKRPEFKRPYPHLEEALANIRKFAGSLFQGIIEMAMRKAALHERTKGKKINKKVSKQKAL